MLAEGSRAGLIRLRPRRRSGLSGDRLIAFHTRYLVQNYDGWSVDLVNPAVRMIELGRGLQATKRGTRFVHAFGNYRAYDQAEVGQLLQQRISGTPERPTPQVGVATRRGRSSGR